MGFLSALGFGAFSKSAAPAVGAAGDWFQQFQPHPDQGAFAAGGASSGDAAITRQMPKPVDGGGYQPPTGGINGNMSVDAGPVDWNDPNRRDYQPNNPIWPAQTTTPGVPGYIDPSKPMPVDPGMGRLIPDNAGLPGNSQLPGYGDWSTSNPWRDALSYQDIMRGTGTPSIASMFPNTQTTQPMNRGGMLGALGPWMQQQANMARMKTPGGRLLQVPMQHIQEALARGAQHV